MLPYHAYYDTLAAIDDVTNAEWQSTMAGLIVLRLVHDWLDFSHTRSVDDDASIASARDLIAGLHQTKTIRPLLRQVLRAMDHAESASFEAVEKPLLRYTEVLVWESRFDLSRDALIPLLQQARRAHRTSAILEIALRLGLSSRSLGDLDQAEEYYSITVEEARESSNYRMEWWGRAGLGKLLMERGDMEACDASTASLIDFARKRRDPNLLCFALQERAQLTYVSGDFAGAQQLLENALFYSRNLSRMRREYLDGDLASCKLATGAIAESQATNLNIAATGVTKHARHGAILNLMCASILESDQLTFELYRQALEFAVMDPWLSVHYRHYAAQGLRHFGDDAGANREAKKGRAITEKYGLANKHLN